MSNGEYLDGRNGMNQDPLLRELAQVIRDQEDEDRSRLDERWDRLSSGQLSAEEEAELHALAKSSTEARQAYEAFRPLGPEFQARVVQSIREQSLVPATTPATARPPAKLLPWPSRTVRWAGWSTAAAAAAALFLLLRAPATLPPLPVYTADKPTGGVQVFRGQTDSSRPVFTPGSAVTLVVRPEQSVSGPVEVRAFLARGGELVPWQPEIEISNGSVRLRGELGREIAPGDWRLWVVVGRPGKIPDTGELVDEWRAGRVRNEHWQAVYANLRVAHQPPP
jgi:hypothetical protein